MMVKLQACESSAHRDFGSCMALLGFGLEFTHSFEKLFFGVPSWLSRLSTLLESMRIRVQSLASLSGLRIQRCLRCRSQT